MTTSSRITLRELPLAARLVLTVFLLAVGLGYFSALVQLHMKHSSKEGEALPTVADVVEHFSGLREPDDSPAQSRFESLLSGNPDEPDVGKENMAPAFFAKSRGWSELIQGRGRSINPAALRSEREGERQAMLAWVKAPADQKRTAYETDQFPLPAELKDRPLTAEFRSNGSVKIRSLVEARCQTCHKDQAPSLGNYEEIAPHVTPPSPDLVSGKWVRSPKQVTVEALTQSTHAHLLSFAVLFTLTGLTFSLTSYPGVIRVILAPIVLIAQVLDVSCWWLARVPDYGPYFAMTIVFTGGIVGSGLMLQIVLSLLNMYGRVGKAVIVLLFLLGGTGFGVLGLKVIEPALKKEREEAAQTTPKGEPSKTVTVDPGVTQTKNGSAVPPPPEKKVSDLERLIMGSIENTKEVPWNKKGSMAAAFFHKDGADFRQLIKERPEAEVRAEREGERQAIRAWILAEPTARKKAYEEDKFLLPADLAGKPITGDYLDESKAVRVKSILRDRCERCHSKDGEQPDYPLETYEQLMKYIDGEARADEKKIPTAAE